MKEDFFRKNRLLLFVSLAVITIITFYPLFFTGFGCADDLQNYFVTRWGKVWENARNVAAISGRFYYLFICPVYSVPFLADNMFVIKLFQIIPLIVCYLLLARILFLITGSKELAFLYFLLVNVLMQASGYTSLFVNYPFYYTFSFSLLLCSYILLLDFLKRRKRKILFFSALLFICGLLFYETYLFFFLIIFFTIFSYHFRESGSFKNKLRLAFLHFFPFLGLTVLYLAAYFIFRIYQPSQYEGTTFAAGGVSLQSFFNVLWKFSFTSFPLAVFESSRAFFERSSDLITGHSPVVSEIILNANVEWLAKGILVACCTYMLLIRLPKIRIKTFAGVAFLSALLIFLPHLPLALTAKYTYYASLDMIGYITTWYSFFGVVLLVTFLLTFVMNLFDKFRYVKKGMALLLTVGIFICSVLTDYSNHAVATDIRSANLRFRAVDELVETDFFRSIPGESNILAADLYKNPSYSAHNLTEQSFDWGYYMEIKSGIYHQVIKNEQDYLSALMDTTRQTYYIATQQAYKDEDFALYIARLNQEEKKDTTISAIVDQASVLYYSKYKIFSVSFDCKSSSPASKIPLKINHIEDTISTADQHIEFTVFNTRFRNASTSFTIRAEGIDLKSLHISNMIKSWNKIFYL